MGRDAGGTQAVTRRRFLKAAAANAAVPFAIGHRFSSAQPVARSSMGVVQYSFTSGQHTSTAHDFLEYCYALGAGGIQVGLDSLDPAYLDQLKRRSAEL